MALRGPSDPSYHRHTYGLKRTVSDEAPPTADWWEWTPAFSDAVRGSQVTSLCVPTAPTTTPAQATSQETQDGTTDQPQLTCPFGYGSPRPLHGAKQAVSPPKIGQFVRMLGVEFEWTDLCWPPARLEPWRLIGDELIDHLLEVLPLRKDQDALDTIRSYAMDAGCGGAAPSEQEAAVAQECRKVLDALQQVPDWVDWDAVARAQEVFITNPAVCTMILTNSSLAGGYGSPNINKVLASTGYLAGGETWRRMMETGLMFTRCMYPGSMLPNEEGWEATVRVRFLHARVRRRLYRLTDWDTAKWGVPINQEDLVATQLVFSMNLVRGMYDLRFLLSDGQIDDWLHLWRLIGYYMGIDERVNPCNNFHQAKAMFQSIFLHQVSPDISSASMAQNLLHVSAEYSPQRWSYRMHAELSRILLGDVMADKLQFPPSSRLHRFALRTMFLMIRISTWFATLPGIRGYYLAFTRRSVSKFMDMASTNHAFTVHADPNAVVLAVPKCPYEPGTFHASATDKKMRVMIWSLRLRYSASAALVLWLLFRLFKLLRQ